MKNKIIFRALLIFCIVLIVTSLVFLIIYFAHNQQSIDDYNDLRDIYNNSEVSSTEESSYTSSSTTSSIIESSSETSSSTNNNPQYTPQKTTKNLDELLAINKYFVGWLSIDGTIIDYPIVHTPEDEQKYIHLSFYNYYSFPGVPFCSKHSNIEQPSDNIVIYGHRMLNGTMFAPLANYASQNFYNTHKYIKFNTIYNGECEYEVISAFSVDLSKESYAFQTFTGYPNSTERAFNKFVDYVKSKSFYNIPTTATYGDKLLTLITCKNNDTERYVIVAKQISGKNLETVEKEQSAETDNELNDDESDKDESINDEDNTANNITDDITDETTAESTFSYIYAEAH